ncbi:MAG: polyprenyl synthetase family protein [Bacteroidetes bacterium]|nr:MAG: polyprenyl synthetase family protein [Bacteroidota bacterium]
MHSPKYFQELIDEEIAALSFQSKPAELYEPIRYMMSLGGKRIRPSLVLMSNELFGADPQKIIKVALGVEVFHNFTLMHDDIMDRAPLRRNKSTVHTKWDANTAILSGDTMFVKSCQLMMSIDSGFSAEVLSLFFKTAIEVCEGQQLDMNFESREDVSIQEYIEMISLKTAVLLGCSLQLGAILADAEPEDARRMYAFGKNLGIAFQLHDDILDLYGDAEKFGKQVGGDVLSNKKTILLLLALSHKNKNKVDELKEWINKPVANPEKKISAVREIFEHLGIRKQAEEEMEKYFQIALNDFQNVKVEDARKETLMNLAESLMIRES